MSTKFFNNENGDTLFANCMYFPATLQAGERVLIWMDRPRQSSCRKASIYG